MPLISAILQIIAIQAEPVNPGDQSYDKYCSVVCATECEASHTGARALTLSSDLLGVEYRGTYENAADGVVVVQGRRLGPVPAEVPEAAAFLRTRRGRACAFGAMSSYPPIASIVAGAIPLLAITAPDEAIFPATQGYAGRSNWHILEK